MQIKTTMTYYFAPATMARTKTKKAVSVGKDVDTFEPSYHWWDCKMVQPL